MLSWISVAEQCIERQIRRKIQYRWILRQNSGEELPWPGGPTPALKTQQRILLVSQGRLARVVLCPEGLLPSVLNCLELGRDDTQVLVEGVVLGTQRGFHPLSPMAKRKGQHPFLPGLAGFPSL